MPLRLMRLVTGGATAVLSGALSATATTFTLASVLGTFPIGDFAVTIDSETIYVGNRSGLVCSNCLRGENATTAAAHLSGASVTHYATLTADARIYA